MIDPNKPVWMCYVSSARCSGPVQVIPYDAECQSVAPAGRPTWVAASERILHSSNVVSSAYADNVPANQLGLFRKQYCTYLLTQDLEYAKAFVEGARALRHALHNSLAYDLGPVEPLAVGPEDVVTSEIDPYD